MSKRVKSASAKMLDESIGKMDGVSVARLAMSSPALARSVVSGLSVFDIDGKRQLAYVLALAPVVFKHAPSNVEALESVLLAALRQRRFDLVARARTCLLKTSNPTVVWDLSYSASQLPTAEALALLSIALDRRDLPRDPGQEQAVYMATFERLAGARPSARPKVSEIERWKARAELRAAKLPEIWLGLARWAGSCGDRGAALSALENAADSGVLPTRKDILKDKAFAKIRRDPRFLALGQSAKPVPFGKGGVRGVPLVDRCIAFLKKTPRAKVAVGASEGGLRGDALAPGVPLPPTLQRYLRHDLSFAMLPALGRNVWKNTGGFGRSPNAPTFKPVDTQDVARSVLEVAFGRPLKRLNIPADDWARIREVCASLRGRLFALPHMGDQQHYLYAGVPDSDGELPILGVEVEAALDKRGFQLADFAIWIKYPSFDLYLADMIELIEDPTSHREFKALCQRHRRKNPELPTG
jgi:hypothetical protein